MEDLVNNTTFTQWIGLLSKDITSNPEDTGGGGFFGYHPWIFSILCSALVGLSGLFPVVLMSKDSLLDASSAGNRNRLRFMLSFACGGLLGDVFLHLLPEAYDSILRKQYDDEGDRHWRGTVVGLWILAGILTFIVVEILFKASEEEETEVKPQQEKSNISVTGYLNLVANCIDNFAHGLAVGGAFLVDTKTGFVTTACILFHEIPHEIGDFAILIKSGFNVAEAAKAQASTAFLGMAGSVFALLMDSYVAIDDVSSWIVPFTGGGFLNIALVSVLPDLLNKIEEGSDGKSDFLRVTSGISLGISVMMCLSKL